ncbi:LamG domain-containing protein [Desulfonema magnum]|uniref:LamG domain-containing protein n=1 Tax=Desulfonema magnum TaxID=45655 RepID=A0A975BGR8_9BACT|nr:LamG domain-containing protein [Desulfonema magnum]QTA84909.1 Uncharacterized protein dnm_009120 [Desulfonema magnum]
MKTMKRSLVLSVLFLLLPLIAGADTIFFKDGRQIETAETWEEGGQIKCYRFGSVIGYPKQSIERIEKQGAKSEKALYVKWNRDAGVSVHLPSLSGSVSFEAWVFVIEKEHRYREYDDSYRIERERSSLCVFESSFIDIRISREGFVRGRAGYALSSSKKLMGNKWHHLSVVFDKKSKADKPYINGTAKLYIDGIEVCSKNDTCRALKCGTLIIGEEGDRYRRDGNEEGYGYIDEVRIWNRAITREEINNNMYRRLTGNENALILYYNFDELVLDNNIGELVVKDLSPQGNNGKIRYYSPDETLSLFNAPVK